MGIFIYTMQHTITQHKYSAENTRSTRETENVVPSRLENTNCLKVLKRLTRGRHDEEKLLTIKIARWRKGKVSVIGQKIFPCETWRPGSRAGKGKSAEIKGLSLTLSF